ncbi:MAG: F0F1 ATP synthase subunit B [Gammaproteobacteria bacterium]|nr:F0F1 ATP synthase subunit B [Gammaproteobacteria bacterium]
MNINLTLLGQMITFMILVGVTMKYIWPPMMKALEDRRKQIADGLEAAERGHHELELARHKATESLRDAKLEAAKLIDQAAQRATRMIEDAKGKAREEGERLVMLAKDQIAQEMQTAKHDLLQQVATLAIASAEKILEKKIDESANNALVDQLIDEI